jgi:hypothetical protein
MLLGMAFLFKFTNFPFMESTGIHETPCPRVCLDWRRKEKQTCFLLPQFSATVGLGVFWLFGHVASALGIFPNLLCSETSPSRG